MHRVDGGVGRDVSVLVLARSRVSVLSDVICGVVTGVQYLPDVVALVCLQPKWELQHGCAAVTFLRMLVRELSTAPCP